jgi:hypothetical protein
MVGNEEAGAVQMFDEEEEEEEPSVPEKGGVKYAEKEQWHKNFLADYENFTNPIWNQYSPAINTDRSSLHLLRLKNFKLKNTKHLG